MRLGLMDPDIIINLAGIRGLSYIEEKQDLLVIGALTTIADVANSEIIQRKTPILSLAASQLGNPLTRNRATIGGNLANASPAADMAPPLLALEASIHTERANKKGRDILLASFFLEESETVLQEDEIITEITIPKPERNEKGSYFKLGKREATAISIVSIAVMLEMEGKLCRKARVALGAVAPTPIRARGVENMLEGEEITSELIRDCTAVLLKEISPISDIRASADYRKLATTVLLKRAILRALA
jgi:carbon-monoxide dehydrogenase medium subunit